MTEKLGIYVALVTPYAKDGTLNPAAQVKLMERNLREGASGFFLGGSSAECWLLSHQERVEIFKTAVPFLSRTYRRQHQVSQVPRSEKESSRQEKFKPKDSKIIKASIATPR